MSHDVFISHSTEDKAVADALCASLESQKIRCWVAPRDILPGMTWGNAIVEAIKQSRLMVLIFSSHANGSGQVMREVERAVYRGIPIIPLRIEDIAPSGDMEYFLSATHWLDALTPPLEAHLQQLTATVSALLDMPSAEATLSHANTTGEGRLRGYVSSAPAMPELDGLRKSDDSLGSDRPVWAPAQVLRNSLGIRIIGQDDLLEIILWRGSPLPCSFTSQDFGLGGAKPGSPASAKIEVFEGEIPYAPLNTPFCDVHIVAACRNSFEALSIKFEVDEGDRFHVQSWFSDYPAHPVESKLTMHPKDTARMSVIERASQLLANNKIQMAQAEKVQIMRDRQKVLDLSERYYRQNEPEKEVYRQIKAIGLELRSHMDAIGYRDRCIEMLNRSTLVQFRIQAQRAMELAGNHAHKWVGTPLASALINRGRLLFTKEQYDEAESHFDETVTIHPNLKDNATLRRLLFLGYGSLAVVAANKRDGSKADAAFEKAKRVMPHFETDTELRRIAAQVYMGKFNHAASKQDIEAMRLNLREAVTLDSTLVRSISGYPEVCKTLGIDCR